MRRPSAAPRRVATRLESLPPSHDLSLREPVIGICSFLRSARQTLGSDMDRAPCSSRIQCVRSQPTQNITADMKGIAMHQTDRSAKASESRVVTSRSRSKFRRSASHRARRLQAEHLEDRRLLAFADLELSSLLPTGNLGEPAPSTILWQGEQRAVNPGHWIVAMDGLPATASLQQTRRRSVAPAARLRPGPEGAAQPGWAGLAADRDGPQRELRRGAGVAVGPPRLPLRRAGLPHQPGAAPHPMIPASPASMG